VQQARRSAQLAGCANQQRQLALACHACDASHGRLPPAAGWFPGMGCGVGTVFFHLLPFIEEENLYRASEFRSDDPYMVYLDYQTINTHQVGAFNCPGDFTLPGQGGAPGVMPAAASTYVANFMVFGRVDEDLRFVDGFGTAALHRSFPDGLSSTILFAEKYAVSWLERPGQDPLGGGTHWAYWGQPAFSPFFALYVPERSDPNAVGPQRRFPNDSRDSRFQTQPPTRHTNPFLCSTPHAQGINVAMADASVRCLSPGIDAHLWFSLVTPEGHDNAD
jgi:hypothetical protein